MKIFDLLKLAFVHLQNPWNIFPLWIKRSKMKSIPLNLKCGIKVHLRSFKSHRVSDLDILIENLLENQYECSSLIQDGDTIIDIGAHVGIFSLIAANSADNVNVLAFEPEASNYEMLAKNIALNPGLNIKSYNLAVAGSKRKKFLNIYNHNTGGHTLLGSSSSGQQVECTTLSDIFAMTGSRKIKLMKIDTEGSEYEIFESTPIDVLRCVDHIVMETHETPHTSEGCYERLSTKFHEAGFGMTTIKTISYPGEGVFHLVSAKRIPTKR